MVAINYTIFFLRTVWRWTFQYKLEITAKLQEAITRILYLLVLGIEPGIIVNELSITHSIFSTVSQF